MAHLRPTSHSWCLACSQTASYARAMISQYSWRPETNVEFCVRARMERQQILRRPIPPRFDFFVQEDALRLNIGGAAFFLEDQTFVGNYRELVPAISDVAVDEGRSREYLAALASEYERESEQLDAHSRVEESSFSGGGNSDCVEVGLDPTRERVRDSKNSSGPILSFPHRRLGGRRNPVAGG